MMFGGYIACSISLCVSASLAAYTKRPAGLQFDTHSVRKGESYSGRQVSLPARSILECTALCELRKHDKGKCARAVFCGSQLKCHLQESAEPASGAGSLVYEDDACEAAKLIPGENSCADGALAYSQLALLQ